MSKLNHELEFRLLNWAHWLIAFKLNEIGYPPKSTIADFGIFENYPIKSKPPFSINNLEADEINGWINIMGVDHPQYKAALKSFYLRKRGEKIREIAQALKISQRAYEQRLHYARTWLLGRLSITIRK